jgi:vesicle-associated membrane protein 7
LLQCSNGVGGYGLINSAIAGRIPFAYLEDIHTRFIKTYGRVANTALAYAMNDEFSRVLHEQMDYFSNNPNADTINRVKGEIAEV